MTEQTIYPWGDGRRYNGYSGYFRRLFGGRVQKVAVNAGFTCPNRDGSLGTGGCTFCDNSAFTPSYCMGGRSVEWQVREGIEFHKRRYRTADKYLVYFQSFSNTYAPAELLRRLYTEALSIEGVVGIVVGTRPDCIDPSKLDLLCELSRDAYVAVEYGVESCYDQTLKEVNRGHDFACARDAITATAARGLPVGAHFILGLPGETEQMLLRQTDLINALPITTIKFHQLQIFKDTPLAEQYARSPESFYLRGLAEYIELFAQILRRLRPDIVVERFAGEAPPRFHAVAGWGPRNEQLLPMLERYLAEQDYRQGELYLGV